MGIQGARVRYLPSDNAVTRIGGRVSRKKKQKSSKANQDDRAEPAPRRDTAPFNARRFMADEPLDSPTAEGGGYVVDDAVGEEAHRVRLSGPRSAAASRIFGVKD